MQLRVEIEARQQARAAPELSRNEYRPGSDCEQKSQYCGHDDWMPEQPNDDGVRPRKERPSH
jgi:hypothetical protein